MRAVLSIILMLASLSGLASGGQKGWSEWLAEGQALRSAGDYSAAAKAFRESLAMAQHSEVDDRQLVVLHDALAGTYADAGQFASAEREYRRALALVEEAEGRDSLHYAVLLASMAVLPTQGGDSEDVIRVLRKAITESAHNGSRQNLAVVRGCLAMLLRAQKQEAEEETLLVEALTDLQRESSPDPHLVAGFLNDLAVVREDQRRYEESIDLQWQSIRILEKALGTEHPLLVVPLNNLATTYLHIKRFEDAGATYARAIALCGKTLGEAHADYGVLLENYAVVLKKLGRKGEARTVARQGEEIERAAGRRDGVGMTVSLVGLR
jgi:tetratricopeptide (TPR) repeat protein